MNAIETMIIWKQAGQGNCIIPDQCWFLSNGLLVDKLINRFICGQGGSFCSKRVEQNSNQRKCPSISMSILISGSKLLDQFVRSVIYCRCLVQNYNFSIWCIKVSYFLFPGLLFFPSKLGFKKVHDWMVIPSCYRTYFPLSLPDLV